MKSTSFNMAGFLLMVNFRALPVKYCRTTESLLRYLQTVGNKLLQMGGNIVFSLSLLCCCLGLSWLILSQINFSYGFWYDQLHIGDNIQRYAPVNRFGKTSFANTDKAEHVRLFKAIVKSINTSGKGLKNIHYQQQNAVMLLTPAEVQHLQDVANLLTTLKALVAIAAFIGFLCWLGFYLKLITLAKPALHILSMLASVIIGIVLLMLVGTEKVFYWAHVQIFPVGHQWFFYYQDSIMSTMMKAPILFAPIACQLLGLSLLLWLGFLYAASRILKRFDNDQHDNGD